MIELKITEPRKKVVHIVKQWTKWHREVVSGERTSQLRKDDRDYQKGDDLLSREYDPKLDIYTGSTCRVLITDVVRDIEGLMPGYCVISTKIGADATRHDPKITGKSAREVDELDKNTARKE